MKSDPIEQAESLVTTARAMVVATYIPFCERFPVVKSVSQNEWDFFGTVAAVWSASTMIGHDVPESVRPAVEGRIEVALTEWHPRALAAMEDLSQFVARSVQGERDVGAMFPAAVGMWMFWNLIGRPAADGELDAASAMGGVFCEQFAGYWVTK